jgi:hypothetical protein
MAAALAAAIVPLVGCSDSRSADLDPAPDAARSVDRDSAAADALADLERALQRRDASAVTELAAGRPGAERRLRVLVGNARRLELRSIGLRHLSDSGTGLTDAQREQWGEGAWVADVQVTWRYGGVDRSPSALTVPVAFEVQDGSAHVLSTALPQAERVPLWMKERVHVARGRGAVAVVTKRHSAERMLDHAQKAARTVRSSLPSWRGVLCVEVPPDQASFRTVAGVPQQQAAAIAAVTTTPDGSTARGSTQHVYVNPRLLDPLAAEGQQIVLAHEAAHVALGAPLLEVPIWLSEGIADHVALARSTTPVANLAAQILRLTREDGAPRTLPGEREFDGSDDRIGAWYEASWLAVRLIALTYGEDALWRFYRRSVRDQGTAAAFREVLGTTQRDFVQAWRRHLTELAG